MRFHSDSETSGAARCLRAALIVLVGYASDSRAAESGAVDDLPLQRARAEFLAGVTLANQGQAVDAMEAFRRSEKLKDHPVTLYNIAFCERRLGRHASAYRDFALALSRSKESAASGLPEGYESQARVWMTDSERFVARVHLASTTTTSLLVLVDGRPIESLGDSTGPGVYFATEKDAEADATAETESRGEQVHVPLDLWLDPGPHRIEAVESAGRHVGDRFVDVTSASKTSIDVSPSLPAASQGTSSLKPLERNEDGAPPVRPFRRTPELVALGVGATGLIASGIFAALTLHENSILEKECPSGTCQTSGAQSDYHLDRAFANVTTGTLTVALAGIGVGAVLWFVGRPRSATKTKTTPIATWVRRNPMVLGLTF